MPRIILIAHNIRSSHNIGALFRTAEGLGIEEFVMTGYSPYPRAQNDQRMPHEADKVTRAIHKTALGAESTLKWQHIDEPVSFFINKLKQMTFSIYALEQAAGSVALPDFVPPEKLALIVGNEITGIEKELLSLGDGVVEIPVLGSKESYNVAAAASMAMYHCVFGVKNKNFISHT